MPSGTVAMPEALTEENGAKTLLIGEFHEKVLIECEACDGDGWLDEESGEDCPTCSGAGDYYLKVPVSWTTIKDIYTMAVKHLKKQPPSDQAISYRQAKRAIELFEAEWIGQEPKQLWDWAVSEAKERE
jgi:hypothetical protein